MSTLDVVSPHIRGLGLAAAAGPAAFLIGWAIGAATQHGFRILRDGESALAAVGADHPWITMTGDTLLGIGMIALAVALVALLNGTGRAVGCLLLAIAGFCTIIQALVREDCVADLGLCAAAGRSDATTWRQPVHDSTNAIAFVATLAAAFVLAGPLRRHGWQTLARLATASGAVGLVLLVVYIPLSDSAVGGLAEFLFFLVALAWMAVLGLRIAGRLKVDTHGRPAS